MDFIYLHHHLFIIISLIGFFLSILFFYNFKTQRLSLRLGSLIFFGFLLLANILFPQGLIGKKYNSIKAISGNQPNFEKIQKLINYPDCEIRRSIISYPNISEKVLRQLIKNDKDVGIKYDAKRRLDFLHGISRIDAKKEPPVAALSPDIVDMLQNSESLSQLSEFLNTNQTSNNVSLILKNLATNCYIDDKLAHDIYQKGITVKGYQRTAILFALASNPKTPHDILSRLSQEKDIVILRGLVSNPNLPADIIRDLAYFPDCKIRKEIICLPLVDLTVLRKLHADKDKSVASAVYERYRSESNYLSSCRETHKQNLSCQKYFEKMQPNLRNLPNTSLNWHPSSRHLT